MAASRESLQQEAKKDFVNARNWQTLSRKIQEAAKKYHREKEDPTKTIENLKAWEQAYEEAQKYHTYKQELGLYKKKEDSFDRSVILTHHKSRLSTAQSTRLTFYIATLPPTANTTPSSSEAVDISLLSPQAISSDSSTSESSAPTSSSSDAVIVSALSPSLAGKSTPSSASSKLRRPLTPLDLTLIKKKEQPQPIAFNPPHHQPTETKSDKPSNNFTFEPTSQPAQKERNSPATGQEPDSPFSEVSARGNVTSDGYALLDNPPKKWWQFWKGNNACCDGRDTQPKEHTAQANKIKKR